jgi:NAD-dependent SIR2 family protein deacetylase
MMQSPDPAVVEVEGPWGVYDAYCLRCSWRYVSVAPVQAEDVDLWECPKCNTFSVTHHPYPDEEQ